MGAEPLTVTDPLQDWRRALPLWRYPLNWSIRHLLSVVLDRRLQHLSARFGLFFILLLDVDVSGLLEAVDIFSRLLPSAWPLPGEVRLELEMTVTGRAMWKAQLTSFETLSSNLAIFSRDRDFIKDNSDKVFFGSLDSGESLTPPFCCP